MLDGTLDGLWEEGPVLGLTDSTVDGESQEPSGGTPLGSADGIMLELEDGSELVNIDGLLDDSSLGPDDGALVGDSTGLPDGS